MGDENATPPAPLDRAITFALNGKVVINRLSHLRKGGEAKVNEIYLDQMLAFGHDKLFGGGRQIRDVTSMTSDDARDFFELARQLQFRPHVIPSSQDDANKALLAVKNEDESGFDRNRSSASGRSENLLDHSNHGCVVRRAVISISIEKEGRRSVHAAANTASKIGVNFLFCNSAGSFDL